MKIQLLIDGRQIEAAEGQTVLQAALADDIYIPHLCHHPDLPPFNAVPPAEACFRGKEEFRSDSADSAWEGCGLCFVRDETTEEDIRSCATPAREGMKILITSPQLEALRRQNLSFILAAHPHACLTCAQREGCSLTQCSSNVPEDERCCPRFDACELRKVAEYVGIAQDLPRYRPRGLYMEKDKPLFARDYNLCIGCLRCVRVCDEMAGARALAYVMAEGKTIVGSRAQTVEESECRFCGACVEVCPTGALRDKGLKPGDRRAALVPCVASCPIGMEIPAYVDLIRQARPEEAAEVIGRSTPLAASLGYICPHPCEAVCRRGELNQPLAICDLKRYACDTAGPVPASHDVAPTGKKVAVVGAGPAGLTAAVFLARQGHAVTVYEAAAEAGGMLRWAIPEYRLPGQVLKREIEEIEKSGVRILTSSPMSAAVLIDEFKQGTWDAIFLATGAQQSRKLDIEGGALPGVHWGLEFLKEARQGKIEDLNGKGVVIGGGNVALDAAMTALRLGASKVDLACLEQRDEMPAYAWDIEEAEEEGVAIHPGWGPLRIEDGDGRVRGVELQRCLSVFDENGNFRPSFDPGQRTKLEADFVILAIGQKPDLSFLAGDPGLKVTEAQFIRVKAETLETNIPGVFAGGEAASGPGAAVEAMAAGRKAASAIDRYLGGKGIPHQIASIPRLEKLQLAPVEEFAGMARISAARLSAPGRIHSMELIRRRYSDEQAQREASRCLRCDFRFRLSPVRLPPEKWLAFCGDAVGQVPPAEGAFQLLDAAKNVIFIAGTPNLRRALQEQLSAQSEARYFTYDLDPMYTKRESELIQQFLQRHGRLPRLNDEVDDLF